MIAINLAVRNDDDRKSAANGVFSLRTQRCKTCFDGVVAPRCRIADIQFAALEFALRIAIDMADFFHFEKIDDRLADFKAQRRIQLVDAEEIRFRPDERHQRRHQFFADRIDRRIGDLRKELLEIMVERLVLVGQNRQRRIIAHRAGGLFAVHCHRRHQEFEVFLRVSECLLTVEQRHR